MPIPRVHSSLSSSISARRTLPPLRRRLSTLSLAGVLLASTLSPDTTRADEAFHVEAGTAVYGGETPLFVAAGWSPNRYLSLEAASMLLALDRRGVDESASAFAAGLRANLPVTGPWSLYGRAGYAGWRFRGRYADNQSIRDSGSGLWAEAGLSWSPDPAFASFVAVRSIGGVTDTETDWRGQTRISDHKAHVDLLIGGRISF